MLFTILTFCFFFPVCLLLVLIILIQKGKGGIGLGSLGGSNLMLFGGSGGQDIFQKITWVLGALFMGGSLILSIMKTNLDKDSRYLKNYKAAPIQRSAPAQS